MDVREMYAFCKTPEEFNEVRQRLNLWLLCDLDPEVAAKWLERQKEGND